MLRNSLIQMYFLICEGEKTPIIVFVQFNNFSRSVTSKIEVKLGFTLNPFRMFVSLKKKTLVHKPCFVLKNCNNNAIFNTEKCNEF